MHCLKAKKLKFNDIEIMDIFSQYYTPVCYLLIAFFA